MDNYEAFKLSQRREQERTGNYDNPWKYHKGKQSKQRSCNCKNDPARHKGTCGTCGGYIS